MALIGGHSRILCPHKTSISSEHLRTAIHFTSLLCGVSFKVPDNLDTTAGIISCEGKNNSLRSLIIRKSDTCQKIKFQNSIYKLFEYQYIMLSSSMFVVSGWLLNGRRVPRWENRVEEG